jgi:RNase adapter protein RapZ
MSESSPVGPEVAPALARTRILLVTGMSGAGKTSALKALEDLGYEAVDNLPVSLVGRLLATQDDSAEGMGGRPLAIGIDARTRAFRTERIVDKLKELRKRPDLDVQVLFLDCAGEELTRRFSETRRRHPLAQDRPVADGIAREREILAPLRRWADTILDTTDSSIHQLRRLILETYRLTRTERMTITVMSFGFARGIPRDADLVFDMRFLSNPHWVDSLRPKTGQHAAVQDYIQQDPGFAPAFEHIQGLLALLLPNYQREGKAYLTIAFGCTGGKHRSVFVAERMAAQLTQLGYAPSLLHRDIGLTLAEPARNDTASEIKTSTESVTA